MPVAVAGPSLGERVRQGDAAAFETLYHEYAPGIYDFLVRLVHDRAAAEDLMQATFIKAFEHRSTLREPEKVRSWLWATAHNQGLNHLARQRKSDPIDEQFDLATLARGPEETLEAKDAAELVWLAAASLEPRQYTVLDLTVRRDLSTAEVAEALGVPVGHAAVLVNRAKEALGHAVRYLLVARRREKCPQLAALVPAGVRALTPEQRSAVDHHMRRCERCRELGDRLTAPAELLGTLILLPLPPHLHHLDTSHLVAAHTGKAGALKQSAQSAGHQAINVLQVVITIAVTAALTVPQSGSAAAPVSPAVLTASKLGANSAAPSTSPTSGTVASTAVSEYLIAIADPPPRGVVPTTQPTTIRLVHPDGSEVNTLTLKPGLSVIGAAGQRVFVLEPGGVLRAVDLDGNVSDLGHLSGPVTSFIVDPSGTRWVWGSVDLSTPVHDSTVYSAGIGLAPKVIDHLIDQTWFLRALAWTPLGPVVVHFPTGIGGRVAGVSPTDYVAQADLLDPDRGVVKTLTGTISQPGLASTCRFTDLATDGTVACVGQAVGPGGQLALKLTSTSGHVRTILLATYGDAGEAYFSPDGALATLVGVSGSAFDPNATSPQIFYETNVVDTTNGSIKSLGIPGMTPAMGRDSWLPDGALVLWRAKGDPSGEPGTFVVNVNIGKVLKISSTGRPIGLLQRANSTPSGYATAAEAAQAAADAFLKKMAASAPAGTDAGAASNCSASVRLGTPTFGLDAAYFQGGIGATGPAGCGSGAALLTYVFKDSTGWHYLDARGTQAGFLPAIGLQGTLRLSSGCVNVRALPSLSGQILSCLRNGATVTVDGGPNYVDGKMWWHLQGSGWMVHDFLICTTYDTGAAGLLSQQC
jgi:RNA polymerase sigma factor (sigma-70 family)